MKFNEEATAHLHVCAKQRDATSYINDTPNIKSGLRSRFMIEITQISFKYRNHCVEIYIVP